MTQTQHNSLPWKAKGLIISDAAGRIVAGMSLAGEWSIAEAELRAKAIVHAVNSHAAIVDALHDCADEATYGDDYDAGQCQQLLDIVMRIARKAIALAEKTRR